MVESVDTGDSKSLALGHPGSSPGLSMEDYLTQLWPDTVHPWNTREARLRARRIEQENCVHSIRSDDSYSRWCTKCGKDFS